FSSRRRHTRWPRDWSSDVCSSDLRDFDAEIQAAVQSAKTAAGFEFLGTLVRVCLLPQSGGEDSSDVLPAYIANPASAPARDTWRSEERRVGKEGRSRGSLYG